MKRSRLGIMHTSSVETWEHMLAGGRVGMPQYSNCYVVCHGILCPDMSPVTT